MAFARWQSGFAMFSLRLKVLLLLFAVAHWCACFWHAVGTSQEVPWLRLEEGGQGPAMVDCRDPAEGGWVSELEKDRAAQKSGFL